MRTPDPEGDTYEIRERQAIQSESSAPESATKFPFGHNADGGPEQIVGGIEQATEGGAATEDEAPAAEPLPPNP
jgi:hypothetical protein